MPRGILRRLAPSALECLAHIRLGKFHLCAAMPVRISSDEKAATAGNNSQLRLSKAATGRPEAQAVRPKGSNARRRKYPGPQAKIRRDERRLL
jgi:hypothetical protein